MALPDIRIRITGDESGGVAATERARDGVDRLVGSARRASAPLGRLATGMQSARRSSGGFSRGVQNAAFQAGDFAVQVGGGVDASRALAQQLPQLLGGFGVLGAVAGAAVAILIPLRAAMQGLSSDGDSVTKMFGTLQPVAEGIATAFGQIGPIATQMAEVLVNNLDRIIITAGVAATFFGARWVSAFVAARVATFTLSGALIALRGALIRTGIGALIVGAGELVYQFTRLVKASGGFGEALGLLKEVAVEVMDRIKVAVGLIPKAFRSAAAGMKVFFLTALRDMLQGFQDFTNSVVQGLNGTFNTSLPYLDIPAIRGIGTGPMDQAISKAEIDKTNADNAMSTTVGDLTAPLESLGKIREMLQGMKDDKITLPDILGVGGEDDKKKGGGKKDSLKDKLKGQEKRIAEHLKRIKALTIGTLSDKLGAWGDYFTNLISLTGSNNTRLLSIGKAFAAAQATVDAWKAYTATLSDPFYVGRPWLRIAAAAQVLAAGIGAVNAIRSVTSGGGGGGGGAAASTDTSGGAGAAAAPQDLPVQQLEVVWRGPGMEMAEQMFEMMNEASRKGYRLNARVIQG